jgi:hypothetical protein
MKRAVGRSPLFQFTLGLTRYVLLGLFSFAVVCLLSPVVSGNFILLEALGTILFDWAWRLGLLLLCLIAMSVLAESLR